LNGGAVQDSSAGEGKGIVSYGFRVLTGRLPLRMGRRRRNVAGDGRNRKLGDAGPRYQGGSEAKTGGIG